jgi:hypothetical protein
MVQEQLLQRLDAIGRSLEASGGALALIALGSVGLELDRIDDYSDLDFFVIVEEGRAGAYREDLGWLRSVCPIAYSFQNSPHGSKLLFEDGIYAEFAVFTLAELQQIEFPPGRIVWRAPGVDAAIRLPPRGAAPAGRSVEWLLGEALTNLYVGIGRFRRGERISALRFIQGYAVDRVLELVAQAEPEQPGARDAFGVERRFEQRYPAVAREAPAFMQGYDRSLESAAAILAFLDRRWALDPAMKRAVLAVLPAGRRPPDDASDA